MVWSAAAAVGKAEQGQPPNILLITADNLGYGDLRCYNPRSSIKTPHLNRLARQGARLTSFYTASPTCTVSRACLLTGRVAQRHGLTRQLPGVEGNYGVGLNPRELLLPQLLRAAPRPYATGCFGKWNIGFAPGSRPTERGFDGHDLLPLLTSGAPSPHDSFYFEYLRHAALRRGDWKIVRERPDRPWQLYHLADDLIESRDLAEQHPDRVADLDARFRNWLHRDSGTPPDGAERDGKAPNGKAPGG